MNFNSPEFLFFLPLTLVVYALVFRRERLRDAWLLAISYFFYMSWNWKYASLILLSTVIDHYVGRAMHASNDPKHRKRLLILSMVSNLGLLAVFKYYNFFLEVGQVAAGPLGLDLAFLRHELLLPVGISFYTFQTMSYTLDIYRRELEPEPSFLKFSVFVSFFPQLVAGPIVRAADFLPQLRRTPEVTKERVHDGLRLVFQGLFKKIVVADLLAGLGVDAIFARPGDFSSIDLLFALYGYSFQIYCDFSGYSDIAIGTARIFGFELTKNFDRPYLAQNVREFWARWHISLSTWLRDYLYISLGGNRGTPRRTHFNLLMTMLLGGLWHGAAMNFVLWGAWHGLLLVFARGSTKFDTEAPAHVIVRRRLLTFHLVVVSWLLFRVTSMQNFLDYSSGLLRLSAGTQLSPMYYAVLGVGVVLHVIPQSTAAGWGHRWCALPAPVQAVVYAGCLLLFAGLSLGTPSFIYFQF